MRISSLLNERKRKRFIKRAVKKLRWAIQPARPSAPVFVFGKQRSGTTMFMDIMENRGDTEVYQEWEKSVFNECRIRDFESIDRAIARSKARFVCFKPICDSHIIEEFLNRYPDGKFIWVYRNYLDNANSSIRRFGESDRAMRLICEGKTGGGWLQEGIPADALATLRSVYRESFSKFEVSCLTWWARNRIAIDAGLADRANAYVLKYEALVREPDLTFELLEKKLGLPVLQKSYSDVHDRSIAKHRFPEVAPAVVELCDNLTAQFDRLVEAQDARIRALGEAPTAGHHLRGDNLAKSSQ